MHPIWHFFDTMPPWAQGVVLTSLLGCIVFAAKTIAVKSSDLIRSWLERRFDRLVIGALKGDGRTPLYLSTIEVAQAIDQKAIKVEYSLERLERQKRVQRLFKSRKWCLTYDRSNKTELRRE